MEPTACPPKSWPPAPSPAQIIRREEEHPGDAATAAAAPSLEEESVEVLTIREALVRFYSKCGRVHANDEHIDATLEMFEGKEAGMIAKLEQKYRMPFPHHEQPPVSHPTADPGSLSLERSLGDNPKMDLKQTLTAYYRLVEPSKSNESNILKVLKKYKGNEAEMIRILEAKYQKLFPDYDKCEIPSSDGALDTAQVQQPIFGDAASNPKPLSSDICENVSITSDNVDFIPSLFQTDPPAGEDILQIIMYVNLNITQKTPSK
jgi:hypothetical protein